jgi:hypothetical protein
VVVEEVVVNYSLSDFEAALREQERPIEPDRQGGFRSSCPAHDGDDLSLSISEQHGRVLVKCHSRGCSFEAIMRALFGTQPPTPSSILKAPRVQFKSNWYSIRDLNGDEVARRGRIECSEGSTECPWSPKSIIPEELPLFGGEYVRAVSARPADDAAREPICQDADPRIVGEYFNDSAVNLGVVSAVSAGSAFPPKPRAVVTEGETAAKALIDNGICALGIVTDAEGLPDDAALRALTGFDVYLWPDNDDPGRYHMSRIADRCSYLGIPAA